MRGRGGTASCLVAAGFTDVVGYGTLRPTAGEGAARPKESALSPLFVLAIVLAALAALAAVVAARAGTPTQPVTSDGAPAKARRNAPRLAAAVLGVGALAAAAFSAVYYQGVGTAKIQVAFGQPVAVTAEPGLHLKAPWARLVTWDLFSRDVLFAGEAGSAPTYANGEITGATITASVARGTTVTFDLQATYQIDATSAEATVLSLYRNYRDQDRFTRQVITPQILSTARKVPTTYQPIEFRGEGRAKAESQIQTELEDRLAEFGISFVVAPTIQNIAFPANVEESINRVEEAQQKEAQAQAELRAAEVAAQTQVAQAEAEAKANKLLEESLTPNVLESKRLDTLREIGAAGNMVIVPEGSTPFVQVQPQTTPVPAG